MWNFSIPYKLKHWIDLVTQPGLSFGFDPAKGYYGLITGTRAVGITDHTAVTIDRGLSGPDADRAAREAAKAQVLDLAATL